MEPRKSLEAIPLLPVPLFLFLMIIYHIFKEYFQMKLLSQEALLRELTPQAAGWEPRPRSTSGAPLPTAHPSAPSLKHRSVHKTWRNAGGSPFTAHLQGGINFFKHLLCCDLLCLGALEQLQLRATLKHPARGFELTTFWIWTLIPKLLSKKISLPNVSLTKN